MRITCLYCKAPNVKVLGNGNLARHKAVAAYLEGWCPNITAAPVHVDGGGDCLQLRDKSWTTVPSTEPCQHGIPEVTAWHWTGDATGVYESEPNYLASAKCGKCNPLEDDCPAVDLRGEHNIQPSGWCGSCRGYSG